MTLVHFLSRLYRMVLVLNKIEYILYRIFTESNYQSYFYPFCMYSLD